MSAIEILAVIGIIGYIIFRQVQGEPLRGKRAVLLPAILTVIGFTNLHASNGAHLQSADILCIALGCAGSAVIGLAFGAIMRLESREGYLWAQLPVRGLWLWGALFGWRVLAMVLAMSMHAHVAASSSTLLFSLGINRLAQAAVIVPRAMAMGVPFSPEKDGTPFLAGLFDRGNAQFATRGGYQGGYQGGASGAGNVGGGRRIEDDVRGYDNGPVDLGREFGPASGRDRGGYDERRGYDTGYDRDRRDNGYDRDRDGYDQGRDSRYDRDRDDDRDRDRRHDRDRDRRHDRARERRQDRRNGRW